MGTTEEELILSVETKGIIEANKKLNKMAKGFLTLEQAGRRMKAVTSSSFDKISKVSKDVSDKSIFSKGGMKKGDGFMNLDSFGKEVDMFGKKINTSFEKTSKKFKESPLGIDQKELDDLTKNFKQVGEVIKEPFKKGAKEQAFFNKEMNKGAGQLLQNADVINKLGSEFEGITGPIKMSTAQWKKFNEGGGQFTTITARATGKLRMLTAGLKGFKMEMLGIMFFGMAMAKMFGEMLNPAAELTGMFEIWGTVLEVVFLPIMLALLPLFIDLSTALIEMGPGAQIAIGIFAILGLILGKALFIFGTLMLGIGSLMQAGAFSGMSAFFWKILIFLEGLGTAAAAVFAIVTAIIIGAILAWKEDFGGFRDAVRVMWEGLKEIFKGVFDVISGFVQVWISLFKGDMEGAKDAFAKIWNGLKGIFSGLFKFILGLAISLGLAIIRFIVLVVKGIWNVIKTLFNLAVGLGKKFATAIWNVLPSWIQKLINGTLKLIVRVFTKKDKDDVEGTSPADDLINKWAEEGKKPVGNLKPVDDMVKTWTDTGNQSINKSIDAYGGVGNQSFNNTIALPEKQPLSLDLDEYLKDIGGENPFANTEIMQTLNISVSDTDEMIRLIKAENDALVNKLTRNV